jgi:hypothetical protein
VRAIVAADSSQLRAESALRKEREELLVDEINELSADAFVLRAENNASVKQLQEVREAAYQFHRGASR